MRFLIKRVSSSAKFAHAISRPSPRIDQCPCFCPRLVHDFGLQSWNARSNLNAALLDIKIRQCEARNQQGSTLGHSSTREFASSAGKGQSMTRDWLIKLWDEEKRKKKLRKITVRRRGSRLSASRSPSWNSFFDSFSRYQVPFMKSVLRSPDVAVPELHSVETVRRPPVTQSFSPNSPEEVGLAPLLSRANLLITRDIEWANIVFAIEQESRYMMVDPYYPQAAVGFISERSNIISRQLLRSRRPFIAHITDAMGREIFRVRRPFWLINSTIYAEVDGKEVGVVHRRWHLWRRIYDLYLGNKQFAVVENPGFWNWTFTLKDEDDNVLAQIDRDWRGLGMELFTDAGQYVIRFGSGDAIPKTGYASAVQELEVARQLSLFERAVVVALAISLDNDYFSRRGGWGLPILIAGE